MIIFFFFIAYSICASILSTTHVYESGTEGYECYRIPAIVRNPNSGMLLAFAESRKYSCADHGMVDLSVKKSSDNGTSWSSLKVVYHYPSHYWTTVGNPVPIYDVHGIIKPPPDVDSSSIPLLLVFTVNNTRIFYTISYDDGDEWTTPTEITSSVKLPKWNKWYATGPAGGITVKLSNNKARFLVACNHGPYDQSINTATESHVIYSDDGLNWKIGGIVPTETTNECSLVELKNQTILISMRNSMGGKLRAFSTSNDFGETFSKAVENKDLPDPRCEASIMFHKESDSLLFANPSDSTKRENMAIHQSYDSGKSWKNILTVHKEGSQYSSLVEVEDGLVGLLYEKSELFTTFKYLEFVKFKL